MGDFDDLFDRGIPLDDVVDGLKEMEKCAAGAFSPGKLVQCDHLIKQAVSAEWVSRTVRGAAQSLPTRRLEEAAGNSMKGVLEAVKKKRTLGQGAVDKRMALHNALQGAQVRRSTMPPKVAGEKRAVSADWVASTARNAARSLSNSRLNQASSGTMRNVLDTVKRKGTLGQAAVDKRMALHGAVQNEKGMRYLSTPPPSFAKAAADKTAISTSFMARAAQGASPERLMQARNTALNAGHRIAKSGTGSVPAAMAYRNQQRFAGVLDDALQQQRKVAAAIPKEERSYPMMGAAGAISGAISGMATAAMVAPDRFQRAAAVGALLGATTGLARAAVNNAHHNERKKRKTAAGEPLPPSSDPLEEGPSAEEVVMTEQQGVLDQTMAENEALRDELEMARGMVEQSTVKAEQAEMSSQQMQQQLAEAETASQQAQQAAMEQVQSLQAQAQESQMQAQMQAQQAAQHADAKMRLSIRIQQIRQQLADLASQDPVTEEGEQPQMAVQTPGQQGAVVGPDGQPLPQDPAQAAAAPPGSLPVDQGASAPGQGGGEAPKPKPKEKAESKAESKSEPKKEAALLLLERVALLKQAASVGEVWGRAKQLFSGSRLKDLRSTTGQARKGLVNAQEDNLISRMIHANSPSDSSWQNVQKAREGLHGADEALRAAKSTEHGEAAKVYGTRAGSALAGALALQQGAKAVRGKQKTSAEEVKKPYMPTIRARLHSAAHGGVTGGLIGSGLNELAYTWTKEKDTPPMTGKRRALAALAGAALGSLHGTTGFNKRESVKDLAALRSLSKERMGRLDKRREAKLAASLELDDAVMARLYGL